MGVRREPRHVGAVTEAIDLALLANLQHRRTVDVLGDDVATEIGQRLRRGGLLGRVEPGVDHHELGA